jgi:hypothetical protein
VTSESPPHGLFPFPASSLLPSRSYVLYSIILRIRPPVPRENPSFYAGLSLVFAVFRPVMRLEVRRALYALIQRYDHYWPPIHNPCVDSCHCPARRSPGARETLLLASPNPYERPGAITNKTPSRLRGP